MASNRKGDGSGSSIVIRPVVATRFLDIDVLEVLGLGDLTRAMLLKAGFGDLWRIKEYTHANLSCEFIRTLRVEEDKNGRFISITFQAMGQERTMPIEQVREAMGMTDTPYYEYGLENKHVLDWWCSITEGRPKDRLPDTSPEKSLATHLSGSFTRLLLWPFATVTGFSRSHFRRCISSTPSVIPGLTYPGLG